MVPNLNIYLRANLKKNTKYMTVENTYSSMFKCNNK